MISKGNDDADVMSRKEIIVIKVIKVILQFKLLPSKVNIIIEVQPNKH